MKQDGKEITGKKEGKNADELFENTWTARPSFPTNKKTDVKWIASKQWKKGGSTVSDHLSKEKTRESVEKRHFDIVKWYKHRDKKKENEIGQKETFRIHEQPKFSYTTYEEGPIAHIAYIIYYTDDSANSQQQLQKQTS